MRFNCSLSLCPYASPLLCVPRLPIVASIPFRLYSGATILPCIDHCESESPQLTLLKTMHYAIAGFRTSCVCPSWYQVNPFPTFDDNSSYLTEARPHTSVSSSVCSTLHSQLFGNKLENHVPSPSTSCLDPSSLQSHLALLALPASQFHSATTLPLCNIQIRLPLHL
jgi:hypothetical protein